MIRSLFKELIFFNSETDIPITSQKYRIEVSKFGYTTMRNESIGTYPNTTDLLSY